jgi:hypothetical protein
MTLESYAKIMGVINLFGSGTNINQRINHLSHLGSSSSYMLNGLVFSSKEEREWGSSTCLVGGGCYCNDTRNLCYV